MAIDHESVANRERAPLARPLALAGVAVSCVGFSGLNRHRAVLRICPLDQAPVDFQDSALIRSASDANCAAANV